MKTTCTVALALLLAAPAAWGARTPCRNQCSNALDVCLATCSEDAVECRDACGQAGSECREKCVENEEAAATDVSPEDAQRLDKAEQGVMDAIDEEGSAVEIPKAEQP
jgi:hypothetical protein